MKNNKMKGSLEEDLNNLSKARKAFDAHFKKHYVSLSIVAALIMIVMLVSNAFEKHCLYDLESMIYMMSVGVMVGLLLALIVGLLTIKKNK